MLRFIVIMWIGFGFGIAIAAIKQADEAGAGEASADVGPIINAILNFVTVGIILFVLCALGPLSLLLHSKNSG